MHQQTQTTRAHLVQNKTTSTHLQLIGPRPLRLQLAAGLLVPPIGLHHLRFGLVGLALQESKSTLLWIGQLLSQLAAAMTARTCPATQHTCTAAVTASPVLLHITLAALQ